MGSAHHTERGSDLDRGVSGRLGPRLGGELRRKAGCANGLKISFGVYGNGCTLRIC